MVLEKTLESPLDCKEVQQSILKEINPEYSLEGLMLKLKLQYFDRLMRRTDSLEKTLMLGKIEGRRRTGWQRMRWLDGITGSTDMSLSSGTWWWTGRPGVLQSMGSQRVRHDWTELNWTTSSFVMCWLTFRLLPCLSYCKQCCYKHCKDLLIRVFILSLHICPGMALLDPLVTLFLVS